MSTIRPFKAIRPKKEYSEKVASKPYDVLSSDEARVEAMDNDYSFLHVVKSEIDLPKNVDHYDIKVYEKARDNFNSMVNKGILFQDEKPMLYIYSQTMNGRTQYGIMGCASVEEYEKNIIKKHELTRKDKEDDRCRHVEITNANTGVVFLTYRDNDGVNNSVSTWIKNNKPEYSFIAPDGIKHEVWPIYDEKVVAQIVGFFKEIPTLYIADGHHRSASAYRVGAKKRDENSKHRGDEEYNFFLATYFPASHLMIMDYNRLVKDLNGMNTDQFMTAVTRNFDVTQTNNPKPTSPATFGMYMDGKWYTLKAKKGSYPEKDPIKSLDVAILQNNLLHPVLGIGDPRTDNRIDFVGGIRGTKELEKRVNSGECKIAFSMYPTTVAQLMNVADAGLIMPPKSTWFEPKLRDGLIVHKLS
ncbi:MAG: DUF1015 family protein [Proteobacteria bacterium]|nr:DUF1015 family protein [Pseudomonadota bacterium]